MQTSNFFFSLEFGELVFSCEGIWTRKYLVLGIRINVLWIIYFIFGQYIYVLSEVNVNDLSLKKEMNARYLRLFKKKFETYLLCYGGKNFCLIFLSNFKINKF